MNRLRTRTLPPRRGRDFFATIFVEPDPADFDSFTVPGGSNENPHFGTSGISARTCSLRRGETGDCGRILRRDLSSAKLKELVGHDEAANFRLLNRQLNDEFVDDTADELGDT